MMAETRTKNANNRDLYNYYALRLQLGNAATVTVSSTMMAATFK
jgi:hypothetical protein